MHSKHGGIIAAGHEETAKAGIEILKAGGNAFDAALAAMLVSFISEASLTSMGGGGYLTAYTSDHRERVFDFFVQTPLRRQQVSEIDYRDSYIDFGTAKQHQYIGKGSIAVPGCPAGLFEVHRQLGSLPMAEIIAPAVKLGREGVIITPYQEYSLKILDAVLLRRPECAAIHGPNGYTMRAGERMFFREYADTLEWLTAEGVEVFYKGEIARAFDEDSRLHGGSIFLEDLQNYKVIMREPLRYDYRGHRFLTNPPPSAGGSLIAYGLERAFARRVGDLDPKGGAYIRELAEVMKEMDAYRRDHLNGKLNIAGNTTQISVMDRAGNAASLTTTLGGASGELIPGTGIQSNNMLGEKDLFPEGMYQWPVNRRVTSMMSPSIVLKDGKPTLVIGTGGSSRIRTAILQVMINMIGHNMILESAVTYPRLHWEANHLQIEPGLLGYENFSYEGSSVTFWKEKNMYFGGTHCVAAKEDGRLIGAGDPRRTGVVLQC